MTFNDALIRVLCDVPPWSFHAGDGDSPVGLNRPLAVPAPTTLPPFEPASTTGALPVLREPAP